MAARLLLEPRVTGLAALAATHDDFLEMDRCLRGGDSTTVYEEFEAWDMALHRSFALATHNTVIVAMIDILHSSRHDPTWGGLKRRSFTDLSCSRYRKEHHDIVAALRDRDAAAASDAMTLHLESVRNAILG
jgi:DNA-binding FadR family transcriptional regulator